MEHALSRRQVEEAEIHQTQVEEVETVRQRGNTLNSRHIPAEEVEVICQLHLALSL